MATDFTNNNKTISTSGGLQPTTRNTPLDVRTRVNLKADIDSIPNPFVGMKILVLQDETNGNQMTEYVVVSLKADSLGIENAKVNEVVLMKDFLGVSGSTSGSGMTSEQVQKLNTAYTHSQSTHVQQSDIPTKTSQLQNDSDFATNSSVDQKIANASTGGTVDLSSYAKKTDLPTKTSQLINDSGYLTQHQDISGKVDKINGKGLSTNDYTTEEKNKLNGIEENANNYSLPIASSTVLGGIKVGSGLSIDSNGVLSSNTPNTPSLGNNITTLTIGNYTITYNETDDTLDFIYNGTIDNPGTGGTTPDNPGTGETITEVIPLSWAVGNLNSSGAEVAQDVVLRSDFVTIETGYSYSFYLGELLSMPEQTRVYFYDSNKGFISRTDGTALGYTTGTDIPIDIPSNAGYMRFKVAMDGNTRLDTINNLFTLKKYNHK